MSKGKTVSQEGALKKEFSQCTSTVLPGKDLQIHSSGRESSLQNCSWKSCAWGTHTKNNILKGAWVCSMRSKWCSRGQESWVIGEVTENYESDSLGQCLKYYYRSGCKFGSEDAALTLLGYGGSHPWHLLTGNILPWKNMNLLEHGFPTLWMTYRTKPP